MVILWVFKSNKPKL